MFSHVNLFLTFLFAFVIGGCDGFWPFYTRVDALASDQQHVKQVAIIGTSIHLILSNPFPHFLFWVPLLPHLGPNIRWFDAGQDAPQIWFLIGGG